MAIVSRLMRGVAQKFAKMLLPLFLLSPNNYLWETRRYLRDYPKQLFPLRLTRVGLLTFVVLLVLTWVLGTTQGVIGLGFDVFAGSVDIQFYGWFFGGLTLATLLWGFASIAVWYALTRLEQHLVSGKWVPPRL